MKELRQKLWGIRYRVAQKLLHRAGLCHPRTNTLLAESYKGLLWSVPVRCDWCGASGSQIVDSKRFAQLQGKDYKYRQKIQNVFG